MCFKCYKILGINNIISSLLMLLFSSILTFYFSLNGSLVALLLSQIILSILNIVGNDNQKKYMISNNQYYEDKANNISVFVLTILFIIYLYFFYRNYTMFNNKDNPSDVDMVKVIGSLFFIIGTLCLLYFQVNSNDNFIVEPEI